MTDFQKILDFAIGREKEAVEFYRQLQALAKFKPQIQILKEFEMMEAGHVRLLSGVKERKVFKEKKYPDVDLKLADFLVEVTPIPEMSYQDILITAIKKEDLSAALYKKLAAEAPEPEAEEIFKTLLIEESNHKSYFEKIYDEEILTDN